MSTAYLILSFIASQYRPGLMREVVANRQAMGHLPASLPITDGFIAVRDCEHIGEVWSLRPEGALDWESFLVADCAMPQGSDGAFEWMTENGIGVEVDHETAKRWDTVGRGIYVERQVSAPVVAVLPVSFQKTGDLQAER